LRPSPTAAGIYGLDMTAGCYFGCPFCHIRGSSRFPGEDKILFDPSMQESLFEEIDELEMTPRQVVLSPQSDPLPFHREVRAATESAVRLLLKHSIPIAILTRGRFSPSLIHLLSAHGERSKVLVGLTTMNKDLSRVLEARAASPGGRLRDIRRLVDSGVNVEVRLEPLVPDRTDTRENLSPLFEAIAQTGVRTVVAHYLFLHTSMQESLEKALAPLGWSEGLKESFADGPSFRLGTIGKTSHLSLETRRSGLAQVISLGAEFGLNVATGAAQNPDLPVASPAPRNATNRRPTAGPSRVPS